MNTFALKPKDQQILPRREGARQRLITRAPGDGARADGRKRRRKIHADEMPYRDPPSR